MAEPTDLLSIEEARSAAGVKGSAQDTRLAIYVSALSRRLDRACGAVVERTVTSELHNGGRPTIRLRHPASAFTAVTEYQGTSGITLTRETPGTAPGDGYLAEPHAPEPSLFSGVLHRRSGGYDACFWAGRLNLAVSYTAGRYATTAAVDELFKEAATIVLANLWTAEELDVRKTGELDGPAMRFPRFAIPNAARQLLREEWRETKATA